MPLSQNLVVRFRPSLAVFCHLTPHPIANFGFLVQIIEFQRARAAYRFLEADSNFLDLLECFRSLLLHDFELKVEFLATHDHRKVELPKLSHETKRGPVLVEIHDKLDTEGTPKIREADVRVDWSQFGRSVERKRRLCGNEAGE